MHHIHYHPLPIYVPQLGIGPPLIGESFRACTHHANPKRFNLVGQVPRPPGTKPDRGGVVAILVRKNVS
ncbi:jg23421, partial [Pararge aegeria aegeria]